MNLDIDDTNLATASVETVAQMTGIPVGTLIALRRNHPTESPPFFRVGPRSIRYKLTGSNSVESWLDQKIAAARKGGAS